MDGEAFFDRLYSQFHVPFPCYAVALGEGNGFATAPATDGTEALVVLTDADLAERYLIGTGDFGALAVTIDGPRLLADLLRRLPPPITHVTFDPSAQAHRRHAIADVRAGLVPPLRKAG